MKINGVGASANHLCSLVVSTEVPIHIGYETLRSRADRLYNGEFSGITLSDEEARMCCASLRRTIEHYQANGNEKVARLRVYAYWVAYTSVKVAHIQQVLETMQRAIDLEWLTTDDLEAIIQLCELVQTKFRTAS